MRTLTMLAAAALASGALAQPLSTASIAEAAEPALWDGDLFITKASTVCTTFTSDVSVGASFLVTYRPNIAPPPAGQAKEELFIRSIAEALSIESTGATLRGKVTANSTIFTHDGFVEGPDRTSLNLAITPARISATSRVVTLSGSIGNFFRGGCNVSVTAVLGPRPG